MPPVAVDPRTRLRGRTTSYLLVLGGSLACCAPAVAAGPGGAAPDPAPVLRTLECRSACAGVATAAPGALIRARGRDLGGVVEVVFLGAAGSRDDVAARPQRVGRETLTVRVPARARTGPLMATDRDGRRSAPTRALLTVETEPEPRDDAPSAALPAPARPGSGGSAPEIDARVSARKVFFAGRAASLSYLIRDTGPVEVTVQLVRRADDTAIVTWRPGRVAPGAPRTITWDGLAGGRLQREGRYEFRVFARGAQGARASSSAEQDVPGDAPGAFTFLRHRFPIGGAHDFGGGAGRFGAGRSGRSHQGQDVFARCGTPLVAARGGVVKTRQYHSAAGNYLIIDGERTGSDYGYMHLQRPALVDRGDRVQTGQLIGYVGQTGRAEGCHLHFELWSSPGWYSGGRPLDPLGALRAWDRVS